MKKYNRNSRDSKKNEDYTDYSIRELFSKYGGCKVIFTSLDFVFALISGILYYFYISFFYPDDSIILSKSIATDLLQVSASLFGILFAAFAIIISLSGERFMKLLKKLEIFDMILFPFWLVSILYIFDIILNILVIIIYGGISNYVMTVSIFIFSWAIFATFYLVKDTINFGRRRADYALHEKKIDALLEDRDKKNKKSDNK